MEPIAFCSRCRGIRVGWNRKYIKHRLTCEEGVQRTFKLLILTVVLSSLIVCFPAVTGILLSDLLPGQGQPHSQVAEATFVPIIDPAVNGIEHLLSRYAVDGHHRTRIAEAIVQSGRRYNLDPKLIAAIVVVESHANPFAISGSEAVGVMQIHLPTWGSTAEQENVNLFKVEDNVALGVRILKGYILRYGLWGGVMRYKGWSTESPESEQRAGEYVQKVKRIYEPGSAPAPSASADLAVQ